MLRIEVGDTVEAFDSEGRSAIGTIDRLEPTVVLRIDTIVEPPSGNTLIVASAVPKGERADWLVEKLSEIGVGRWIPLRTARSVVHPEGEKTKRWDRIAIEAAKQSRRAGIIAIDPLTDLFSLLDRSDATTSFVLSTRKDAAGICDALVNRTPAMLLIGPEGGWADAEEDELRTRGLTPVSLGPTILRIETAAVVAAGIVRAFSK